MKDIHVSRLFSAFFLCAFMASACQTAPPAIEKRGIASTRDLTPTEIIQFYDSSAAEILKFFTFYDSSRMTAQEKQDAILTIQQKYEKTFGSFAAVGGIGVVALSAMSMAQGGGGGADGIFGVLAVVVMGGVVVTSSVTTSSGGSSITAKYKNQITSALAEDQEFNKDINRRVEFFRKIFDLKPKAAQKVKDVLVAGVTKVILENPRAIMAGEGVTVDLAEVEAALKSSLSYRQVVLLRELINTQAKQSNQATTSSVPKIDDLRRNLSYLRVSKLSLETQIPSMNDADQERARGFVASAGLEIKKLELALGT